MGMTGQPPTSKMAIGTPSATTLGGKKHHSLKITESLEKNNKNKKNTILQTASFNDFSFWSSFTLLFFFATMPYPRADHKTTTKKSCRLWRFPIWSPVQFCGFLLLLSLKFLKWWQSANPATKSRLGVFWLGKNWSDSAQMVPKNHRKNRSEDDEN